MAVASAVALVGAGVSAYTAINEANKKKKAAKALQELKTPELSNVAENLQVSTLGADLQREEAARTTASQLDALRESGTRGVVGGVGRVAAQNQAQNRQIAADLDQQQKDIDLLAAQDETRVQNVQENRNIRDVSALSSQYDAANQAQQQAIGNTIQGLGSAATSYASYRGGLTQAYPKGYDPKTGRFIKPSSYGSPNDQILLPNQN